MTPGMEAVEAVELALEDAIATIEGFERGLQAVLDLLNTAEKRAKSEFALVQLSVVADKVRSLFVIANRQANLMTEAAEGAKKTASHDQGKVSYTMGSISKNAATLSRDVPDMRANIDKAVHHLGKAAGWSGDFDHVAAGVEQVGAGIDELDGKIGAVYEKAEYAASF